MTAQVIDLGRRDLYLGASEVAAALGISRYSTPRKLWAQKTGRLVEATDTVATRAGAHMESFVADEYASARGVKLRRQSAPEVHPRLPWFRAHLDRRVVGQPVAVECKSVGDYPDPEYWGDDGTDEVPPDYWAQIAAQLCVAPDLERVDLPAVFLRWGLRTYSMHRDELVMEYIEHGVREFWRTVEADVPPPAMGPEDSMLLHPADDGSVIVADEATREAVYQLRRIDRMAERFREQHKRLTTQIMEYMGESADLVDDEGRPLVAWRATKLSPRIRWRDIAEDYLAGLPAERRDEIVASNADQPKPQRRFRITIKGD